MRWKLWKVSGLMVSLLVFLSGCQNAVDPVPDEKVEALEPVLEENTVVADSVEPDDVEEVPTQSTEVGKIHFINTGNSDAILIENGGEFAMIDTGDTDDDATVGAYLRQQGVTRLSYLILTHYHADHIGGADTVLRDFEVETTLVPNGDANTNVYREYIEALSMKGLKPSVPLEGATFHLGEATLTLYNTSGGHSDENNNSLVVLYEHGDDRALFTGDAEAEIEQTLEVGTVELLKVGHHGSKTSSSSSFINQLRPKYAVILTGQPNQYGHPHEETLQLFASKGILVYRTDEQGHLVFQSTGHGFETALSPGSYTPGQGRLTPETNPSNSQPPQYKDDNPNGIYDQEPTGQRESYQNCTKLREVHPDGVPKGHPAYESKHDRDKDGWACER